MQGKPKGAAYTQTPSLIFQQSEDGGRLKVDLSFRNVSLLLVHAVLLVAEAALALVLLRFTVSASPFRHRHGRESWARRRVGGSMGT